MSSIFELFGSPELAGEDAGGTINEGEFEDVLSRVIGERPVAGRPPGFDPDAVHGSSAPGPVGEPPAVEGGIPAAPAATPPAQPASPPAVAPPAAPPAVPPVAPAPVGPFGELSDLELQELLAVRQAMQDPERASRVRQAYLGVDATPAPIAAAPPAAPVAPPAPTLPEQFEPGSVEAQLWEDNQATQRELAELRSTLGRNEQVTQQQIINHAATTATQRFSEKYGTVLSPAELQFVCESAGYQKLPDAIYPTTVNPATGQGDWNQAMERALEFALRSNDAIFAKVIGGVAGAPALPTPGTRTPEADTRTRKLTALSSAASPSGEGATRTPITSRPDGTGKMSEKSRLQLVAELVNGDGSLRGSPGEGI